MNTLAAIADGGPREIPCPRCSPVVEVFKRCSTCGVGMTAEAWRSLRLLGYQQQFTEDGEPHPTLRLEMRNCACLSTLTVEVPLERTIESLRAGDMLASDEVERLFGADVARRGGGWSADGRVYVCTGAHRDGTSGWRVGEVRGSRASWNF